MYKGQIPFDDMGDLVHYAGDWRISKWKDNKVFHARLSLVNTVISGRSAKYLEVVNVDTTNKYVLFVRDFLTIAIKKGVEIGGYIEGDFCFVKRGQNFGIALVD